MHATFSRRGTKLPLAAVPEVLAGAFSSDPAKQRFWTALRQRMGADCVPAQLDAVVSRLEPFLAPVLVGSVAGMVWEPGGPWTFARLSGIPKPPNVS